MFHSELAPDKVNEWIALAGAALAGLTWVWRHTIKALLQWFWNALRAPQRIEEISQRLNLHETDVSTAIGLARATWDTLPGPVWQCDAVGLCVHVNRAYRELLGYQFCEVSGLQWKQVIYTPDKMDVYREWASAIQDRRPFDMRCRWVAKSGRVIPVHVHDSVLLTQAGTVAGRVAFVTVLEGGAS